MLYRLSSILFISVYFFSATLLSAQNNVTPSDFWREISPGYKFARYEIPSNHSVIKSEVFLLKFSPKHFSFAASTADELSTKRCSVRSLAIRHMAVAAINTNFFDPTENPLGLVIKNGGVINRLQNGGSLLTGIFYVSQKGEIAIVHRNSLPKEKPKVAFQAGPRLLADRIKLKLKESNSPTRRSGVAIDADGELIIFATRLRYPGASLAQLQEMLLDQRINAVDALNFDGGGSSQLFISSKPPHFDEDVFISGGDTVPVALIVKHK